MQTEQAQGQGQGPSTDEIKSSPEDEIARALQICAVSQDGVVSGREQRGGERPQSLVQGLLLLRDLSRADKRTRLAMVEAGTVQTLLRLQQTEEAEMLCLALTILHNLSSDEESAIGMNTVIPFVSLALAHASLAVNESAAAVVFSLSRREPLRDMLLSPSTINPLVRILSAGTEQGKRDSCKALFNLSYSPASYPVFLDEGVVPVAVSLLYPADTKLAEKASCLLSNLARCAQGCKAIANCNEGLSNLVDMLTDGSALAQEHAAATLLLIAQSNPSHRRKLVVESPFIALNGLQNKGTPRARLKAAAILNILRQEGSGSPQYS